VISPDPHHPRLFDHYYLLEDVCSNKTFPESKSPTVGPNDAYKDSRGELSVANTIGSVTAERIRQC
jgi:hypothetical protein